MSYPSPCPTKQPMHNPNCHEYRTIAGSFHLNQQLALIN